MRRSDAILVAGGGIGGLSCALALSRAGFPARVMEQAAEFSEIGAGIQLGPNMIRALDALDVRDAILADAWFPPHLLVRDAPSGAALTRIESGDGFLARFGEPYALTHRADLMAALHDACAADPDIELLSGQRVESVAESATHVTVETARGDAFAGTALVGADGLWSRVREHVMGDGDPIVSGHIAYRGVLTRDQVADELWSPDMTAWVGPRLHLVHYPIRHGDLYNLVAVFHSDRYSEGYDQVGDSDELKRYFKGMHPNVRRVMEKIETWKYWVLCDREPRRGWSRGRITLLGDAAHAMLQYLGQGAAMAVEDAIQLATELRIAGGDPAPAFARYEDARVLRTGRAQILARVYGAAYHAAGVTAELRNEMLADRTKEEAWDGLAWLYDYRPAELRRSATDDHGVRASPVSS